MNFLKPKTTILILTLALTSSAFADNEEMVRDSQVDTGSAASLDDYFSKVVEKEKESFAKSPLFLIGVGAASLTALDRLLMHSRLNTLKAQFHLANAVDEHGLARWGSDELYEKQTKRLQSKLKRISWFSAANKTGLLYLMCDGLAGVYVMSKGYEPKYVGTLPALLSYVKRSPDGVNLMAKDFDPREVLQKSERLQIQKEFEQLKTGIERVLDSVRK